MQPAVIVEGQPVRHWLLGLLSGGELVPMHAGRFQSASEAVGALCRASPSPCGRETALRLFSQQLRFLHIEERIFQSFKASRNSLLQCWLPLSLWNIRPDCGPGG